MRLLGKMQFRPCMRAPHFPPRPVGGEEKLVPHLDLELRLRHCAFWKHGSGSAAATFTSKWPCRGPFSTACPPPIHFQPGRPSAHLAHTYGFVHSTQRHSQGSFVLISMDTENALDLFSRNMDYSFCLSSLVIWIESFDKCRWLKVWNWSRSGLFSLV